MTAIDSAAGPAWDRFVESDSGDFAHAYHLEAWKAVHRRAYGREPIYLAARDRDGVIIGGLPLVAQGGPLRGLAASLTPSAGAGRARTRLSSVIRGGPLGTDVDARAELLRRACALVDEGGYSDLRIQSDVPGCEQLVPGLRAQPGSPAWLTPLPGDPDELLTSWRKTSKNLSRNIVKSQQRGVLVRPIKSRTDLWRFYRQYVLTMRRHRAVPRSWLEVRFAHKLLARTGRCRVWLGEHQGEVIAGAMFLSAGTSFELLYAGSDPRANDLRPTHAVYWHALEWAIANGKTIVDWGTAPVDSSLGKFKRQWSAEPTGGFQYMYTVRGVSAEPAPPTERPEPDQTHSRSLYDRVPIDALGIAATLAHRVL